MCCITRVGFLADSIGLRNPTYYAQIEAFRSEANRDPQIRLRKTSFFLDGTPKYDYISLNPVSQATSA